jgi:hypothetical protein
MSMSTGSTGHIPTAASEVHNLVRHRCRNVRCGAKLKTPVKDPREAFCCSGCFGAFYRSHCLVCEAALPKGPANREICRRAKCRQELRKYPHLYRSPKTGERPSRNAHFTGPKIVAKPGRPLRIVAGPAAGLDPINLAIPLDSETAARIRRAHQRGSTRAVLIGPHDWPINLIGGGDLEHRRPRPCALVNGNDNSGGQHPRASDHSAGAGLKTSAGKEQPNSNGVARTRGRRLFIL